MSKDQCNPQLREFGARLFTVQISDVAYKTDIAKPSSTVLMLLGDMDYSLL